MLLELRQVLAVPRVEVQDSRRFGTHTQPQVP